MKKSQVCFRRMYRSSDKDFAVTIQSCDPLADNAMPVYTKMTQ